jgi:hypothetical protein
MRLRKGDPLKHSFDSKHNRLISHRIRKSDPYGLAAGEPACRLCRFYNWVKQGKGAQRPGKTKLSQLQAGGIKIHR